jgi:hypothetical protein
MLKTDMWCCCAHDHHAQQSTVPGIIKPTQMLPTTSTPQVAVPYVVQPEEEVPEQATESAEVAAQVSLVCHCGMHMDFDVKNLCGDARTDSLFLCVCV